MLAAALLGEEARGQEATRLLEASALLLAPAHWKAELTSVVWKAVVFRGLGAERGAEALRNADAAPITSIDVAELWHGALARAVAARQSPYDTLFVELAQREGIPMASYDEPLRKKFPDVVFAPSALLRGGKA